jgi:hypothetical protein
MRYLKKFNESVDQYELKEFCEINLAYLLDQGFEVLVTLLNTNDYSVEIRKYDLDDYWFKWDQVKDYIIPFLIHLRNEYKIRISPSEREETMQFFIKTEKAFSISHGIVSGDRQHRHISISVNKVINDNLDIILKINDIGNLFFYIKNE